MNVETHPERICKHKEELPNHVSSPGMERTLGMSLSSHP